MRTHTMRAGLAAIALVGTLALAGCASTPPDPDEAETAQGGDAASAFLGCLTAAGVDAKINAGGQVLVKQELPTAPDGSVSFGSDDNSGEALSMESDDAGNTWIAAVSAAFFTDDPDTQDAYAACEQSHPEFTQPQVDPAANPEFREQLAEEEEAALAFAQCARENGFPQIADPDYTTMSGILLPDDFTEDDFRALVEACYDPAAPGFGFGTSVDSGFDPWEILEEYAS